MIFKGINNIFHAYGLDCGSSFQTSLLYLIAVVDVCIKLTAKSRNDRKTEKKKKGFYSR